MGRRGFSRPAGAVITATTQQAELVESVRTEGVRHVLSLDRGAERSDVQDPHRGANFTCAAVLVVPESADQKGRVVVEEHRMYGRLLHQSIGEGGFGYDPIFVPSQEDEPGGQGRTSAQMSAAEKNAISHRGQALRALAPQLAELF